MTLLTYGFIGFSIAAAISGSIYFIASYIARSLSSRRLGIYFYRLTFVLILSFLWSFWCAAVGAAQGGNLLDPDFWYSVAFGDGIAHGALSGAGWIVVALIDCPKQSKPPNTALEPTPTAP
ncbi:MAG: hypothetical protein ACREFE_19390 [Limisphaerales bacterium]